MTGTQNIYLLLWITGIYLFCGGNRVLARDGLTHTELSIEHEQEKSDPFQRLPPENDTKTLMRWKDVIETRDIHYIKWYARIHNEKAHASHRTAIKKIHHHGA